MYSLLLANHILKEHTLRLENSHPDISCLVTHSVELRSRIESGFNRHRVFLHIFETLTIVGLSCLQRSVCRGRSTLLLVIRLQMFWSIVCFRG